MIFSLFRRHIFHGPNLLLSNKMCYSLNAEVSFQLFFEVLIVGFWNSKHKSLFIDSIPFLKPPLLFWTLYILLITCLQTFWAFSPVLYKLDPKRLFYWVPHSLLLLCVSKNVLILDSTERWSVCHDYIVWIHFQEKRFTAIFMPTVCKPELGMQWSRERMYYDFDFYGHFVTVFVL